MSLPACRLTLLVGLLGLGCGAASPVAPVADDPGAGPDLPAGTVVLEPGDDLQAAVDAHGPGTVFRLEPGRYPRQSVVPRDDMTFELAPGAVLDGEHAARHAFHGAASGVTIRGGVIEHYASRPQQGAIHPRGPGDASGDGWTVEGVEVRENRGVGVVLSHRMRVLDAHIHHNAQLGIGGIGDDALLEGNEVAFNNPDRAFDWGWEAGGVKVTASRGVVYRDNHVHDNGGPGLWSDINCVDVTYEENTVTDNAGPGIFHEISYDAVVAGNEVRGNGFEAEWMYRAEIVVAHSSGVEVVGNAVEARRHAIVGLQQERRDHPSSRGPHLLADLWVHGNEVTQPNGVSGLATDTGNPAVFHRRGNRFDHNTYHLAGNRRPFSWEPGFVDVETWRGAGLDVHSTFHR